MSTERQHSSTLEDRNRVANTQRVLVENKLSNTLAAERQLLSTLIVENQPASTLQVFFESKFTSTVLFSSNISRVYRLTVDYVT